MLKRGCWFLLSLLVVACQKPSEDTTPRPKPSDPVSEARSLIDQGQLDAALAKLIALPESAESLCAQGMVWARKAEKAPLPTPPAIAPGDDTQPRAPEFKIEEIRALDLFDRALKARSDLAEAYLHKAEILAPHALLKYELEQSALARSRSRRRRTAPPAHVSDLAGPDFSPARVAEIYQEAARLDSKSTTAVDALLRFATRVHRSVDIEWCLKELVSRKQMDPEPLIRYGDFLLNEKKDQQGAIARYREALIWRPEDATAMSKIAEIYIQMGREHFDAGQWSLAESRFKEAQKYVTNPNSPQGLKVSDYMQKLRSIRSVTTHR